MTSSKLCTCSRNIFLSTIGVLLILQFISKISIGLTMGYDPNLSQLSEFLINYEGGFVRRGLLGQILFEICQYFNCSPVVIPYFFCIVIWLVTLAFFLYRFHSRQLLWWILLSPIMFGMAYDIVRKDYITYIIAIAMFMLVGNGSFLSLKKYAVFIVLMVLGLFVHESMIFYAIPIGCLMLWKIGNNSKFSLLASFIAISIFALLAFFKGNDMTVNKIMDSWNHLQPADTASLLTSKENSIGAIGWELSHAVKYHLQRNFHNPSFGWFGVVYQPIVMFFAYYLIMNFTAIFIGNRDKADYARLSLSSVFIFVCICLIPMFLFLSCDYARLYQYAFVMAYAVYLILPYPNVLSLSYIKTSSRRLANAKNRVNRKVINIIHGDSVMSVATPPIITLNTKPNATINTSMIDICFNFKQ